MRKTIPLAFVAAALFAALPVTFDRMDNSTSPIAIATAQAAVDVNVNVFFTSLSPYGSWVPNPTYNFIWVPTQVDSDWTPYSNGHWVYTDRFGWYFVSDEPFAWAVYHYGRWGFDPGVGWYWVPGTQFAGAWVAWRRGDTDVGWAPLPPQGTGYATSVNISINIGDVPQHYWHFVQAPQFLAPQLRTVVILGDRRPEVFRATQPAGTVIIQNNVIVNNIININFIEQQTKTKVEVAKVDEVADPKDTEGGKNTPNAIKAFVADVKPADKSVAPAKVVAKAEVEAASKTKGQAGAAVGGNNAGPQIGALPDSGNAAGPGAAPGNPKCIDATFAKANPKDCAPAANAAANANPNAGGTPPASGPNATGNAGAAGNANANAANAKCADADFAKANPKDCAPAANAAANANPNAGGTPPAGGPNASGNANANATPNAGGTPPAGGPNATGNANANANAGGASGPGGPNATGNAGATGNANANANANSRCADATFAKNNPNTCKTTATVTPPADAKGNANAQGNANAPGNANGPGNGPNVQGNANPNAGGTPTAAPNAAGNGGGNANANANARCTDPTFAKNNPKTCTNAAAGTPPANATGDTNVQGNAGGNAGTGNSPAGGPAAGAAANAGANAGGNGAPKPNISVQGNANIDQGANRCADPAFAKANPKTCPAPGTGAGNTPAGPPR